MEVNASGRHEGMTMRRIPSWRLAIGRVVLLVAGVAGVAETPQANNGCESPDVEGVLNFQTGAAEGVALSPDGDLFVGNINTGEIWVAPHGDFGRTFLLADLVTVEHPLTFLLGMDVTSDGALYVALNALGDAGAHGLWRIERNGTAARVAAFPMSFASLLNDVAIDRRGNVYVSDSIGGRIWRLTRDGHLDVWSDSALWKGGVHPAFQVPFGVNGLTYHEGALYGATYLEGRVVRVSIGHDGLPGTPEVIVEDPALIGADGIELDATGDIYVAVNDADRLVRIRSEDREIETVIAEGLSAPASFVISSNRKEVFVANLGSSALSPRPPAPALVRATFCAPHRPGGH
jgi:sugar lactone lactonase YvrE